MEARATVTVKLDAVADFERLVDGTICLDRVRLKGGMPFDFATLPEEVRKAVKRALGEAAHSYVMDRDELGQS